MESTVSGPISISISSESSRANKTGAWRYLRPLTENRGAPCRAACPVGNDIPKILTLVRDGEFRSAFEVLKETNPLPGICGRVCYHPCEIDCNRCRLDEPAAIQALERFLADYSAEVGAEPAPVSEPQRIAIVGSGPGGLSCAYFLAWSGYSVKIFEAETEPGGMLRIGIPEYRLPRLVLDREIQNILTLGVEFEGNCRVGEDVELNTLRDQFDAVFIASGAHQSRLLEMQGERGPGVLPGLEFLRYVNRGDPPPIGSDVVVIGGGNTAMDSARACLRLGARATVVYRRSFAQMPALPDEIEDARSEGVRFIFRAAPRAFARKDGRIQMTCVRMKLAEPDSSGRPQPVPIPGSEFTLETDTILSAIGERADLEWLDTEDRRLLLAGGDDRRTRLAKTGLFLGGDARTGPATVVEAIASGRLAAEDIMDFFGRDQRSRQPMPDEIVGFDRINTDYFPAAARQQVQILPAETRVNSFQEIVSTFTPEQARREAERCFSCGRCNQCDNCWVFCPEGAVDKVEGEYLVDLEYCKGCGICAVECPRGVISLVQEIQ